MSEAVRDISGNTFDLPTLLYDLIQRAAARLKRRGCYKPEDCAPKLVVNYVVERKLRKTGRCFIRGRTISINFPGARDPLLVLYKLLSFEVLSFRRLCNDCNCTDQLPEESDDGIRRVSPALVDVANPESMLEAAELFELIGRAFPNEAHRAAFDEIVIDERPYSEVADRFNISPDTLRQWICRDKKRIRKVILTCMQ
jgi:hypothetical protein